jgi:hypothetical protein
MVIVTNEVTPSAPLSKTEFRLWGRCCGCGLFQAMCPADKEGNEDQCSNTTKRILNV